MGMRARFWVAMAAGLLLGLAVVGSSTVYPLSQYSGAQHISLALSQAHGTGSTYDKGPGWNGSLTQAQNSTASPTPVRDIYGPPSFASLVSNLGSQPPATSILVMVPVAVGLLFGVLLQRAAEAKQDGESHDAK